MTEHCPPLQRLPLGRQQGVLAVEAAYVLPVVIAAVMMFMELASIGLTINMGASALERAVQQFRQDGVNALLQGQDMQSLLRTRMAQASHRYLAEEDIATIDIEPYATLDAMGGGDAAAEASNTGNLSDVPAWRISVDIRKEFITPLPRLLGMDSNAFRYRYQQVLAYLPQPTENTP
ncbi:UNVERIFIED_ORG: Flp pilus assembly protein TadG [Comamonas terrigena]